MSTIPYKQILGAPKLVVEPLTIATQNTVPALTKTPSDSSLVKLIVNGVQYGTVGTNPPISVTGKAITWSAANAGFALDTTDKVRAEYTTAE